MQVRRPSPAREVAAVTRVVAPLLSPTSLLQLSQTSTVFLATFPPGESGVDPEG